MNKKRFDNDVGRPRVVWDGETARFKPSAGPPLHQKPVLPVHGLCRYADSKDADLCDLAQKNGRCPPGDCQRKKIKYALRKCDEDYASVIPYIRPLAAFGGIGGIGGIGEW